MSSDDEIAVDHILEVVDDEMSPTKPLKVVLFDIGGVCVVSPFQAILDYETKLGIPPGWVNYSISKTAPSGFWHRLEMGKIPMDAAFFAGFNRDLHDPGRWNAFYQAQQAKNPRLPPEVPPLPEIDGEWLFHEMMGASRYPDPWMFPALKKLKASGKYIVAALSNTVIFPSGHELSQEDFFDDPVKRVFDVFISSAHVGLRKPDPKIYNLALQEVNKFAKENGDQPRGKTNGWDKVIEPEQVLFLDDIGENLKAAKASGFRTIKVPLGKAFEAVEQLEDITRLSLAGDHPKIPMRLREKASSTTRAKI